MEDVQFLSNFLREDSKNVEDIAKQISEHAEKIYQTWREKGLSANDLIQLHNADFVKQMSTPIKSPVQKEQRAVQSQVFTRRSTSQERMRPGLESTVELIASPDIEATLEELVTSFVKEDKARLAARQDPVPSRSSPIRTVITPQRDITSPQRSSPIRVIPELLSASPIRVITPTPQRSITPIRDPLVTPQRSVTPTRDPPAAPHRSITQIGSPVVIGRESVSPPPQRSTTPVRETKVTGIYITKTKDNSLIPERTEVSYKTDLVSTVEDYRNRPEAEPETMKMSQVVTSTHTHSTVDYAKKRYEVAQANPVTQQRLSNTKNIGKPLQMNVVSETRTRFESKETFMRKVTTTEQSERLERKLVSEGETLGLPHPYVTVQQRQQLKSVTQTTMTSSMMANGVPVRPFLTRGSVAERILIFEKRPEKFNQALRKSVLRPVSWKSKDDLQSDSVISDIYSACVAKPTSPVSTLTRKRKPKVLIPRFYFPYGRPSDSSTVDRTIEGIRTRLQQAGVQLVNSENLKDVVKLMNIPLYWKVPLFKACAPGVEGSVAVDTLVEFWKGVISTYHDEASHFVHILTAASGRPNRTYLVPDDFVPVVQDVVETHPGLTFLKEATEFHSRYINTVIARIFYDVNRSWSGKLTLLEIRRSNLLSAIRVLQEEEDINKITYYFSYEHFYVIYCKFWELDKDHDLLIDREDLSRHNEHAISSRVIERIFSGAVMRDKDEKKDIKKMSYSDFVWFLLAEEDKRHPTAIEYWFRCMDLDGDGYISMYELEHYYEEQLQKMESIGIESLPFRDCLCQMLDMVNPKEKGLISLKDLRNCKMTPIFFDTFINLEKYLDHEQRDPFSSQADSTEDGIEVSDWDRYAAEEYALLVAEEGCADENDENMQYAGKEEEI